MSLIIVTFYKARMALLSMFIVLMVFLVGFSLSFTLGFGSRIYGFRNFKQSFLTLIKAIFSEFQYSDELEVASPAFGPLLQLLFQGFVNFCLVSLMIAIIEDAYQTAQEELNLEGGDKDILINNLKQQLYGIGHVTTNMNRMIRRNMGKLGRSMKANTHIGNDNGGGRREKEMEKEMKKEGGNKLRTAVRESKKRDMHSTEQSRHGSSSISSTRRRSSLKVKILDQYHEESESRFTAVHERMSLLEQKLDLILHKIGGGDDRGGGGGDGGDAANANNAANKFEQKIHEQKIHVDKKEKVIDV